MWAIILLLIPSAFAEMNPARDILAERVPFAFTPAGLSLDDFSFEWLDPAPPDVTLKWSPNTLEWVRLYDTISLPRAVAELQGGAAVVDGKAHGKQVPLPLWSGQPFEVRGETSGKKARVQLKYRGSHPVTLDATCSPNQVQMTEPMQGWVHLGCRFIWTREGILEVYMHWEGEGELRVNGAPVAPESPNLWIVKLGRDPLTLERGNYRGTISARMPERARKGFLGLGVGPYTFTYQDDEGETQLPVIPLATVYAGYYRSDDMRLVLFNGTAIGPRLFSDTGVYVWIEQFRALDSRLSLILQFGANGVLYTQSGNVKFAFGAPQGFEVIFRDFLMKNRNISVGGFLFPKIAGNAYVNAWVRWGSPAFFAEFNALLWQRDGVFSRSVGISVGMPLLRFF